ncbi:hypothetical protein JR316_0000277 [Psilocybe cubensis]|uniref:Uncharacterized protein n=1 Tax=Psilocybe cubensis TaxID=181762 RepID=A0ACB8HDW6_PSICU|nr:hypothetical protein JR316_0000277 [Psilocybe cubensis]KAH9486213.1 hypothetical protein JR316_0000277 [Psilocybe cubensis]
MARLMGQTDSKILHSIFILAAETFLANPGHQEVHRDIGERMSSTEYEDEIWEAERECGGILCGYADLLLDDDDQVDEDEEEDSDDSDDSEDRGPMNVDHEVNEDEDMHEDEDDDGFIVPDTYVEYEDDTENSTDSDSPANSGPTAKFTSPRQKKKGRRKSSSTASRKNDDDDDDIRNFVVPDTYVEYEDGFELDSDANFAEADDSPAKSHMKHKQSSPKHSRTTKTHSTSSQKDDIRNFVVPDTFVEYEDGIECETDSSSTESDGTIIRTAAKSHHRKQTHQQAKTSRRDHRTSSKKGDDDDIRNFVVSDDCVEYEDGAEPPESDSESSDDEFTCGAAAKSKPKSRTKRRRSSQKKGTPRTTTISSRTRSKTKPYPKKKGSQLKRKYRNDAEYDGGKYAPDDEDELVESRDEALETSLPTTVSYTELDDESEDEDDDIPLTQLAEKSLPGHSSSDSESDEPPAKKRKTKNIMSQDDFGRKFENRGLDIIRLSFGQSKRDLTGFHLVSCIQIPTLPGQPLCLPYQASQAVESLYTFDEEAAI